MAAPSITHVSTLQHCWPRTPPPIFKTPPPIFEIFTLIFPPSHFHAHLHPSLLDPLGFLGSSHLDHLGNLPPICSILTFTPPILIVFDLSALHSLFESKSNEQCIPCHSLYTINIYGFIFLSFGQSWLSLSSHFTGFINILLRTDGSMPQPPNGYFLSRPQRMLFHILSDWIILVVRLGGCIGCQARRGCTEASHRHRIIFCSNTSFASTSTWKTNSD